ncbi:pentapeptide repeat-containing protein [Actinosynnema sp. NPDC059797]
MVSSSRHGNDRDRSSRRSPVGPESGRFPWRWVWTALFAGLGAGVAPTVLLRGSTTAEHRDAFTAGWRSTAAVLATFAVFLTTSRLRLSQREHQRQLVADEATRQDAAARQITELATRASEQLGAENTATRIGGLHALERLAQSHPDLRQMVVDQVCSYLRLPYSPPLGRARTLARDTASPITPGGHRTAADDYAELDVRRVAQAVLRRHLSWPSTAPERPETFWGEIAVDLRDAVLVDLDMGHCRVLFADFADADLHGTTRFSGSTFTSVARFDGARFGGDVTFYGVKFHERAEFSHATFGGDRYLLGSGCRHHGDVEVDDPGAAFGGFATFRGATFHDTADFERVRFKGSVHFQKATFSGRADFMDAAFDHTSEYVMTLHDAGTTPAAQVTVDLGYTRMFDDAVVLEPGRYHCWPPAWQSMPDHVGATRMVFVPDAAALARDARP